MVAEAIRELAVRGAPAIGVAAAYACVLALREARTEYQDWPQIQQAFHDSCQAIAEARPTAVNLAWAVRQMQKTFAESDSKTAEQKLLKRAQAIEKEDIDTCRRIGENGASFLKENQSANFNTL